MAKLPKKETNNNQPLAMLSSWVVARKQVREKEHYLHPKGA